MKADKIPPAPNDRAVWLDGEWRWQGRRWLWVSGTWVTPPAGARFARWETQRKGTTLLFAPGVFYLPDGSSLSPDNLREAKRARPTDVPCVAPTTAPASSSAAAEDPAPTDDRPSEPIASGAEAFPRCAAAAP